MSAAIEFEGATKVYRRRRVALDEVTFAIAGGARACLLGPNGAGKSTAIRLLEGALRATAGRVRLLGRVAGTPGYEAARRRTGVVPQAPGMYSDLEAGEYLRLVSRLYGRPSSAGVVEAFGLGPHLRTRMHELSGGYQRRLVLAGALLSEPEVLLLDEPTVGLDPVAAHDVHEYLRAAMVGRTTLLCTHNLAEAERLCDEVVILDGGRVALHKSLDQLRRESRPRLRLAAAEGREALSAALARLGRAHEADGEAVLVLCADARADAPSLLRALLGAGLDVFECSPIEASLESMFLQAVRR